MSKDELLYNDLLKSVSLDTETETDYKVGYHPEGWHVMIEGRLAGYGEDMVHLTRPQALALLAWLERERDVLESSERVCKADTVLVIDDSEAVRGAVLDAYPKGE